MNPVEYVKEKGWSKVNIITEDLKDGRDSHNNAHIELYESLPISTSGVTLLEETDDRVVFEGEYEIMADIGPSRPLTKEDTYVKIIFEKVE